MSPITALIRNKEKDDNAELALVENLIRMREREYENQTREFARDIRALETRRSVIESRIASGRNYAAWLEAAA